MLSEKNRLLYSPIVGFCVAFIVLGLPSSSLGRDNQLLRDPFVQRGVRCYATTTTNPYIEGNIQYTTANGAATATLSQWRAKQSLYGSASTTLASGAVKWSNPYQSLTMGPTTATEANLVLRVNSSNHYNGIFRDGSVKDWPELHWQDQGASNCPWLSEITAVDFNLDALLSEAQNNTGPGYDPNKHSATHSLLLTIQNLRTGSPGYGDLISFVIHPYDSRYSLPGPSQIWDPVMHTIIYNAGLSTYTTQGMTVGKWKRINGDFLAEIKKGLLYAWDNNVCTESLTYDDYKIQALNLHWECPGLTTVTMQTKNFSIKADTTYGRRFITSTYFTGSPQNDYTGWRGMMVQTGATPIVLTHLGRWVVAGNSGTHTVKVINAATKADVPGASVSVDTSAAPAANDFMSTVPLSAPVTLAKSTKYYVVSHETNGGDSWYAGSYTSVTFPVKAATVPGPVYGSDAGVWTEGNPHNRDNGPVTFRYTTPLVTAQSLTSGPYNNYTGWRGLRIVVGEDPITVTGLGRYVVSGNTGTHTVKLVEAYTKTDLTSGSVVINTNGAPANAYKYAFLPYPVTLIPGAEYWLISSETFGGDKWHLGTYTTVTPTDAATVDGIVYGNGTWTTSTFTNHTNGPLNMLYTSPN